MSSDVEASQSKTDGSSPSVVGVREMIGIGDGLEPQNVVGCHDHKLYLCGRRRLNECVNKFEACAEDSRVEFPDDLLSGHEIEVTFGMASRV